MWVLAIVAGVLVALAVILLRNLIVLGEYFAFGAPRGRLVSRLADLAWWEVMRGPIIGGIMVALLLRLGISFGWGPNPKPFGLNNVITHRRLRGPITRTTLSLRDAFHSALIAVISLGWGASAGREDAAIHLGAALAILPGRLLGMKPGDRRVLLGMGAAAAVAAVLHAPIAGVFLARELILRRQPLSSLGPVALAAVVAWGLAHAAFDGRAVIDVPEAGVIQPAFHLALIALAPLFALVAWLARWIWREAPQAAAHLARMARIPVWLLPVVGGVMLGLFALAFPPVIGVGYEPLAAGLGGHYNALLMLALVFAKLAATAITLGCRFGGGPIGPVIWIGGMVGSAFGVLVGLPLGDAAGAQVYFGVTGLAVALAVLLNAPLAAAILAFELSGSAAIGAASLAACFMMTALINRFSRARKTEKVIVAE